MRAKPILLLTCCINPGNMIMTALTDVEERKRQYYEAFDYYLKKTSCSIVIVENTEHAIDEKYLNNSRIEYITFDGNNFSKEKGKGFGELLIVDYALKNSIFIKETPDASIIKITGRLKILSISKHLRQVRKCKKKNTVFVDIETDFHLAYSYFFVANKFFFEQYFFYYRDKINDSEGFYFEHALAKAIQTYMLELNPFKQLLNPIDFYGFSGTTGMLYRVDTGWIKSLKMKIKYIYFKIKTL